MHCPIAVVPSVNICTASLLLISSISMQRLIAVVCRLRMQLLLAESFSVFVIWLKTLIFKFFRKVTKENFLRKIGKHATVDPAKDW
jgi:hypothetical protein